VVLYDGLKNILIVPLLLAIRRRNPPRGAMVGHFFFWYAFLRIFVDVFREYPTTLFGLATGQGLNIAMSIGGLIVIAWAHRVGARRSAPGTPSEVPGAPPRAPTWPRRIALALLLLFCLLMPSDWTQDVPARYGKRHPGLRHSPMYPPISSKL
jgi:phosphatidylglycerol:prolipoprotein diacylglycerol transferase